MNAAHTPGPWRYEAGTKTIRSVPANYWLATLDSWDGAVNNAANARVMAAAPELLAVLVQAVEASEFSLSGPTDSRAAENGEPAWVCNARAVIAQAA
jgi:hypothetical protein